MPIRLPVILDESAYGRLVDWPQQPGWNTSTHLAQIDFGHGEQPAYVKLMYLNNWPALANEAIGWQIAHALDIAAPDQAAIVVGSASFWQRILGRLPKGCPATGDIAAWCTSVCTESAQQTWISLTTEAAVLAVLRSPSGRQIAAFDTWLCQIDRDAPRNLIRLGSGRWAVVDHEMLFNAVRGNWRGDKPDLSATASLLRHLRDLEKSGRINHKDSTEIRSAMIDFAQAHIGAIARIMPYLSDVLAVIEPPRTARSVLPLIVDRAWPFWMPDTVGLI